MVKWSSFDKRCLSLEVKSWEEKLKIIFSRSGGEVATISQLKQWIRFFSFDRFLNLIRSNSFPLYMSDMFKTWWKSIRFKAYFRFLYRIFESLSNWLIRSILSYISSRNNFFWDRLYVKEVRKVALATLKVKT